jgi:hypothetical protein
MGLSAIQRYQILAGPQILNQMPASRPDSGYPYAVINGAQFPAQEPGLHASPNDFLTQIGGNTANIVNQNGALSLRVSDDCEMAIEDTNLSQRQNKEFYATQSVVDDANKELARVNSSIRLQPGAQTITILTGKYWGTERLRTVTPLYNGGSADQAPQNCNEMVSKVLGVSTGPFTSNANREARLTSWEIGGISRERSEEIFQDKRYTLEDVENNQVERYVNYRDASVVRRLKANELAQPEVGDAYMISTIGHGTPQPNGLIRVRDLATGLDRDIGWSYHFAGVVAKSGSDRVTLENFARDDGRAAGADPRWYFRMYGEGHNQSFHEFFSARPSFANPVTIALKNPNRKAWWQ